MQALKIRIHGSYWDSFLYDDQLYLVDRSGVVRVMSWDRLVDEAASEAVDPVLLHLGTRGRAWYGLAVQDLLKVPSLRQDLLQRVQNISQKRLSVLQRDVERLERHASGLAYFPTTDAECYGSILYFGSEDGLLATDLRRGSFDLGTHARIYDGPSLRLEASYSRLAVAQGEQGLVELPTATPRYMDEPFSGRLHQISNEWCDNCSWVSYDILATRYGKGGYIGAFESGQADEDYLDGQRQLLQTVSSSELFGLSGGTLVGGGNLLALIQEDSLSYQTWNPYRRKDAAGVGWERSRGELRDFEFRGGSTVVDAALTVFGLVAEYENGLTVYGSDGRRYWIPGEPVSWRVFPRSNRYLNQLHIVKEEWIDVYAFAHDYFQASSQRTISLARPRPFAW